MLIVYDSKTGNVERFVKKLGLPHVKITDELKVDKPYVLITYTTGMGKTPETTTKFIERSGHSGLMKGVCASGNINWTPMYAESANNISRQYGVEIIHKFEMAGMPSDVEKVKEGVLLLETHRIKQ